MNILLPAIKNMKKKYFLSFDNQAFLRSARELLIELEFGFCKTFSNITDKSGILVYTQNLNSGLLSYHAVVVVFNLEHFRSG